MNDNDDNDESYLIAAKSVTTESEKVWCRINDQGELSYIDWKIVENLAKQFNDTPANKRSEQMLIGKLMVLVRDKTRAEYAEQRQSLR